MISASIYDRARGRGKLPSHKAYPVPWGALDITRPPAAGELLDDHQTFVARSKGTGPGTYEKQLELYSSGRNGGSAFDGTWMRERSSVTWRDV